MLNLYGISISTGILFSLFVAEHITKKEGKDPNTLWGLALFAIIPGIIGARLYHVIDYFWYYSQDPIRILQIWHGGMGIWGGIAGAILGIGGYLRYNIKEMLSWLNIVSITVPLGQSIGRWGNFFNKELFGQPTSLPWGLYIPIEKRPVGMEQYSRFHPLFFYESVLNFILFIFLFSLWKKDNKSKTTHSYLHIYLLGYGVIRFSLEFLRISPWQIHGLNVAQLISILVILYASIHLIRSSRVHSQERA